MTERIRTGVDPDLEAQADALIKQSFLEQPDPIEKSMILTTWMLATRLRREVYTTEGTPDGSVRRGLFHRARNTAHPHLNATDGVVARPNRFTYKNAGADE